MEYLSYGICLLRVDFDFVLRDVVAEKVPPLQDFTFLIGLADSPLLSSKQPSVQTSRFPDAVGVITKVILLSAGFPFLLAQL